MLVMQRYAGMLGGIGVHIREIMPYGSSTQHSLPF